MSATAERESTSEKAARQLADVRRALERLTRLRDARRVQPVKAYDLSAGDKDHNWLVADGYTDDRGDRHTLNFFEDRSAAEAYLVLHAMLAPSIATLEEAVMTLTRLSFTTPQVMAVVDSINGTADVTA